MKISLQPKTQYSCVALTAGLAFLTGGCSAEPSATKTALPVRPSVLWADGTTAPMPQGRLISDNAGYFGDTIPTGVTYSYPAFPAKRPDVYRDQKETFGRRLLDGNVQGNNVVFSDYYVPVIMENAPLAVVFDFKQVCTFNEIDVADSEDAALTVKVETSDDKESWSEIKTTFNRAGKLFRLQPQAETKARYVRLTFSSGAATTAIDEVWFWGDAKPAVAPAYGVLPGMPDVDKEVGAGDATILSAAALATWRQETGSAAQDLTWQVAPSPWTMLQPGALKNGFLPDKSTLQKPLQVTAARNEGEPAALYLVNASDKAQDVKVSLGAFKKADGTAVPTIKGQLSVAGSVWTRRWGQTLRPLFAADNKLGSGVMEKYIVNAATIKDFPTLHLPAGGTAMLWLTVHTNGTPAGDYKASLTYGQSVVPVQLKVRPVTLPLPNVWLYAWNETTKMQPFRHTDALPNEVSYMQQDLGITVWSELPVKGSAPALARELEPQYSKGSRETYYRFRPAPYETDLGYAGKLEGVTFSPEFKTTVANHIKSAVSEAKALGLSYDEFSFELWDEPWAKSLSSFAAMVKLFKEVDPKARLIANPLFWGSKGSSPDAEQVRWLKGWYNENVDISIPVLPNLNAELFPQANREFYDHPRFVRAMYVHPCPGRLISWEAFSRGYNGWGFYAYNRQRGDAWNDFDTTEFDYSVVYPGPHGAIPTIESEMMRESWDDYRLLTLLKSQNKGDVLNTLLARFKTEVPIPPDTQDEKDRLKRSNTANEVLPQLRVIALEAAVQK